jgi:serine/threonine protein kinase
LHLFKVLSDIAYLFGQVADFGLSREETVTQNGANIRGTYGYLDPEYASSQSFTKKSDVCSYGVLLLKLIAGRNPQQGLMEYVELVRVSLTFCHFWLEDANLCKCWLQCDLWQAAINVDGRTGWEEIADSRLEGAFDVEELNDMAAVAYRCVSRVSRKRPAMRDVVQALTCVLKRCRSRKHHRKRHSQPKGDDESVDLEASEVQSSFSGLQREESVGSVSDLPDVWPKLTRFFHNTWSCFFSSSMQFFHFVDAKITMVEHKTYYWIEMQLWAGVTGVDVSVLYRSEF